MNTIPRALKNTVWPTVFVLLVGYGLWLLRGGYLHYEGAFFLSAFLDERSIGAKLVSSHFNQWDCYQGRELSFLFGLIDARAIAFEARMGVVALYSATNIVAFLATAVLLWKTLRRIAPRLSVNQSGLIVSMMLTTPVFALSTYYYRTAKALTGLFLVLLVDELSRVFAQETAPSESRSSDSVRPVRVFAFAFLMTMSDPVGTAFIVLTLVILIGMYGITRRARRAIISLMLAVVVTYAFSLIGAMLSTRVDGFAPDTIDQHILLRYTFANPRHYVAALGLWRDHVSHLLGNWGLAGSAAFATAALVAWRRVSTNTPEQWTQFRRDLLVLVCAAGTLLLLYVVMYAKLTSITWPESRRIYYWIPTTVSIAIATAIGVSWIVTAWPSSGKAATGILAAMLCTNILTLPGHRDVVANGEQHVAIGESPRVRQCMRSPGTSIAEFGLSAGGAQACGSVRVAAFGSAGPGGMPPAAIPNPLLYCRKTGRR